MRATMRQTTTYRIVRLSPLQNAKIASIMWLLAGIPYAFFAQFPSFAVREYMAWWMVGVPLAYALLGGVVTLLGSAAYNLIAPRVGGIVYTVRRPVMPETEGTAS